LSTLINDFVTRSYFADRQKFLISRLAKIVVDSILSFQLTHAGEATFSLYCDGAIRWTLLSELLNVKNVQQCCDKNKAAILDDCKWDENFLDGEVQHRMIEKVRCHL
jgi:hypothetical protein